MYKRLTSNLEDNLKQIKYDDIRNFIRETCEGKIPKEFPIKYFDIGYGDIDTRFEVQAELCFAREVYNKFCSWSIISDNWISEIANLLYGKKCIEIMAGNGLLSHALQIHGIDITPYDNFSWECINNFTTVYDMDAVECADKLEYDYIICSWPPYQEATIAEVIRKMYHKHPNSKMIYIGENQGGCTACDRFFDTTSAINHGHDATIIDKANRLFTSFDGIYDYIHLLKPNDKASKYTKRMNKYANDEIY